MKNLSFTQINNPIPVDRNTVKGTIGNLEVVVSRRLDGWNARINVTISGITWHDDTVTEAEKKAFNGLVDRAHIYSHSVRQEIVANVKAIADDCLYA